MSTAKFNIVLYEPVIPQNTGSIARLCACTGAALHLIHPLGFKVDEASVKRAGLDYWPHVEVHEHRDWNAFLDGERPERLAFFSKFSGKDYVDAPLSPPAYLVFGSESSGLPEHLWKARQSDFFRIPMRTHLVRSLNLSQAAAVVLYEALRQEDFADLKGPPPQR